MFSKETDMLINKTKLMYKIGLIGYLKKMCMDWEQTDKTIFNSKSVLNNHSDMQSLIKKLYTQDTV